VWPPLKGTKIEVEAMQRLWRDSPQPVVLTGAEADEMALRRLMPGSRYVHLATHGFFADETFGSMFGQDAASAQLFGGSKDLATARQARVAVRNPLLLSGVVLAGADLPPQTDELGLPTGQDGILTAEEIVSLDLRNTELVVLSACDTGLGAVARGEGVMGLVRAFRLAGARNVVASLWEVEDKATAALMKVFYYKLWKEAKPPIEALRDAQLTIYRNPDLIDELADVEGEEVGEALRGPRGPVLEPVPIPKEGPSPVPRTADPRDWAAFVLSGAGR
jgi:CHAT domain-containing protein